MTTNTFKFLFAHLILGLRNNALGNVWDIIIAFIFRYICRTCTKKCQPLPFKYSGVPLRAQFLSGERKKVFRKVSYIDPQSKFTCEWDSFFFVKNWNNCSSALCTNLDSSSDCFEKAKKNLAFLSLSVLLPYRIFSVLSIDPYLSLSLPVSLKTFQHNIDSFELFSTYTKSYSISKKCFFPSQRYMLII